MRRRNFLILSGSGLAAAGLAACGGGSGGGDGNSVEGFTWWAAGSEKVGLDALVEVFNEQYPDIEFINGAVAGGAGSAAKDMLQSRLQAGDPPDTFQAHAGAELTDYIDAGQILDVSDVYDELGLREAFPDALLARLTAAGASYSVPATS